MAAQPETTKVESTGPEITSESAIEQAKRAFALKKYEQAVEHYATALELATQKFPEDSPEIADLYFLYGKALLENAISQSTVLGKEKEKQEEEQEENKASGSGHAPVLSFSGDAEDEEDPAVDLFAQASKDAVEADDEQEGEEEEGEDAEPEDDFNAAWEVLDLARAIYDKQRQTGIADEKTLLKLADIYITLGDVSLETEKFDQAITDYEAGLELKTNLLTFTSRQIAEAHYKLSIVLDMTSGRLADAIAHAQKALSSIQNRISELREQQSNPTEPSTETKPDPKGKGKATANSTATSDVKSMTATQIEGEIKELSELQEDLALKIEELKVSPNESLTVSAPALAAQALDKELNGASGSGSSNSTVVNDLTKVVRKKKNAPAPTTESGSSGKRKADDSEVETSTEKRPKLDTPGSDEQ